MFTRRTLLAGVGLLALCPPLSATPTLAAPAPEITPLTRALYLIERKVRESFAFVRQERGGYYTLAGPRAAEWLQTKDLRARILRELRIVYRSPEMERTKRHFGSVVDNTGRLHCGPQRLLMERFPIVPHLCDRELFMAFAAYAPGHLL